MIRRFAVVAVASAFACVSATVIAAFLYLVVILRERANVDTVIGALVFGWGIALRGCLLAVPASVLFAARPIGLSRALSIGAAGLLAAVLGIALSYWLFKPMFHVSREYAAVILALTWASAGMLLALGGARSPN